MGREREGGPAHMGRVRERSESWNLSCRIYIQWVIPGRDGLQDGIVLSEAGIIVYQPRLIYRFEHFKETTSVN